MTGALRVHSRWFALWIVDLALMTAVLLAPGSLIAQTPSLFAVIGDKGQHLIGYLILGTLSLLAFRDPRTAILAACAMVLHGIAMEFLQRAMAVERAFEVADMVADAAGVACGVVIGLALRRSGQPRTFSG